MTYSHWIHFNHSQIEHDCLRSMLIDQFNIMNETEYDYDYDSCKYIISDVPYPETDYVLAYPMEMSLDSVLCIVCFRHQADAALYRLAFQ